jgi:DNA-binding transcriptional MerR regulator
VRYYQTLGLVDKPLHYDGRRAIYGYRHLLQLLAVKRLQQEGNPLHLIQRALAGRPTHALEQALAIMLGGKTDAPRAHQPLRAGNLAAATGRLAAPAMPPPAAARGPEFAGLVAARLAPGITLVVDPEVVQDPSPLISALAEFLHKHRKEH